MAILALAISCAIVFQGLRGPCHMKEEIVARSITYTVVAAAIMA